MKRESSACPHDSPNFQQGVGELSESNNRQLAEDFDMLFLIPWRHHRYIIDKVKGYCQETLFFVLKTLENWGRGMLMNSLTTDLYERQGAAQTNFVISRDRFFFHARNQKLSLRFPYICNLLGNIHF